MSKSFVECEKSPNGKHEYLLIETFIGDKKFMSKLDEKCNYCMAELGKEVK